MRKRRLARVRFIRPSWNAKRSTCEKCGAIEEQGGRLLMRLNICMTCMKEESGDHNRAIPKDPVLGRVRRRRACLRHCLQEGRKTW